MEINLNKFKHRVSGQVRFNEVDMFNVVHNVQYFNYFEWARVKYFDSIGFNMSSNKFMQNNLFMVVHQEADFFNSAKFYDEYTILTRTTKIGDKSITMENVIMSNEGVIFAIGKVVFAHINPKTGLSEIIPDTIKNNIMQYDEIGE